MFSLYLELVRMCGKFVRNIIAMEAERHQEDKERNNRLHNSGNDTK